MYGVTRIDIVFIVICLRHTHSQSHTLADPFLVVQSGGVLECKKANNIVQHSVCVSLYVCGVVWIGACVYLPYICAKTPTMPNSSTHTYRKLWKRDTTTTKAQTQNGKPNNELNRKKISWYTTHVCELYTLSVCVCVSECTPRVSQATYI